MGVIAKPRETSHFFLEVHFLRGWCKKGKAPQKRCEGRCFSEKCFEEMRSRVESATKVWERGTGFQRGVEG